MQAIFQTQKSLNEYVILYVIDIWLMYYFLSRQKCATLMHGHMHARIHPSTLCTIHNYPLGRMCSKGYSNHPEALRVSHYTCVDLTVYSFSTIPECMVVPLAWPGHFNFDLTSCMRL